MPQTSRTWLSSTGPDERRVVDRDADRGDAFRVAVLRVRDEVDRDAVLRDDDRPVADERVVRVREEDAGGRLTVWRAI